MDFIQASPIHAETIAGLAKQLWPNDCIDELKEQFVHTTGNCNRAVFLCLENGLAVGFAEFSLRNDYVEGTISRPVGYVEAVYVRDEYRRTGIAKVLIHLGEEWARGKGCTQIASDCGLTNENSLAFHLGCGFTEVNRIICFVKNIDGTPGAKHENHY